MNPTHLTCDFEQSTINGFKTVFPNAYVKTCFFHFSQNLWRKIVECSLSSHIKGGDESELTPEQHTNATNWFNGAVGLALIPPHLVQNTCVDLMDNYTVDEPGGDKFNDYLVTTYVDYSSARFKYDLWNVYHEIIARYPRTNNHVEGFNRRMNSVFPTHPHIFTFIKCLLKFRILPQ